VPDLTDKAANMLWPVIQILGLLIVLSGTLVLTVLRGLREMEKRIKDIAEAMLAPIAEDVMKLKASAKKAHLRVSRVRSDLKLPPDHYDEYEIVE
jgi:hypothetical protein